MTTPAIPYKPSNSTRNTASGIFLGSILTIIAFLLLCLWATTQYVAHWFSHQSGLGEPLFYLLSWPVYEPWAYFIWLWKYGNVPGTKELWSNTLHFLIIISHSLVLITIVFAIYRAKRVSGKSDNHGSSRWRTPKEIKQSGLIGNANGVTVGGWEDPKGTIHYLRHDGPEHLLAFAPSRSGKGIGLVVPTLLTWPHSVVIHDPKAENWALTAGWRNRQSTCLRFDPTCTDGTTSRYNPLLEIRKGQHETRDAQDVADILVDPASADTSKDPHWEPSAKALLTGIILHVLYTGRDKSITGCLRFLSDPEKPLTESLTLMLNSPQPTAASVARAMLNKSENELSGIVSTASRCLSLWEDPIVAENTATSDFMLADIMNHERPVSLYLATPTSDITRTRALMRLILNQLGRRITEHLEFEDGQPKANYRHRLLMMLDEFPSLGRLDFFQTALAYLAGYGVKCYLIAQDLSQLYSAYGRNESIISNCHLRIAYAPNKIETAKLLSDMAGQTTIHKPTRTYTGGRLQPMLMHVIAAEQEASRALLMPDEALRLPGDTALIFEAGQAPIYGRKLRYFDDPILSERSRIPPPMTRGAIRREASPWTTLPATIPDSDQHELEESTTERLEGAELL